MSAIINGSIIKEILKVSVTEILVDRLPKEKFIKGKDGAYPKINVI